MQITLGQSFVLALPGLPNEAIALAMIWLPPGAFLMGSPFDEPDRIEEEERQFLAILSRGFWLGKYAVTQAQWLVVMGYNPSHFRQSSTNCPVENISWDEAMAFCQRLNQTLAQQLPTGYTFNLPAEVQWEYACRAGASTRYNTGDSRSDLDRAAWHKENSEGHTHPVGQKESNAWGLHDMHGNIFEWCFDPTSGYPNVETADWVGSGDGFVRSIRSGSWGTPRDSTCHRCASRGAEMPNAAAPWFGFRLCLREAQD